MEHLESKFLPEIRNNVGESIFFIVRLKTDLENEEKRRRENDKLKEFAKKTGAYGYYSCSSKRKIGLDRIIRDVCIKVYFLRKYCNMELKPREKKGILSIFKRKKQVNTIDYANTPIDYSPLWRDKKKKIEDFIENEMKRSVIELEEKYLLELSNAKKQGKKNLFKRYWI